MYVMRVTTNFEKDADGSVQAGLSDLKDSEISKPAIVITYRNVASLPATRVDDFPSVSAALEFVRKVEPTCPRQSLGGRSPEPTPTWQEHLQWLHEMGLRSAAEGDQPMPYWAKEDANTKEIFVVDQKGK